MGWWHREQQKQAQIKAEQDKKAAEQAKKDQEAAARQQLTNSWKDLYNSGGDAAVSQSILNSTDAQYYEKNKKWQKGSSYNQQDYNAAVKVRDDGGTFKQAGEANLQKTRDWYDNITGHGGNTTTYGAQGQTIYQLMPFSDFTKDHQSYDWSDGSYDERIKSEKAAADKAAADKAAKEAEAKRLADEARRAKEQADLKAANDNKQQATQNAINSGNKVTQQKPVQETPAEEAKGRTEEYKKTTTSNGNTITNNITQNIGNKGDTQTNITNNGTINNSEIGNDKSNNQGSINVTNEIESKKSGQAWNNDSFVRQLATERASAYQKRSDEFRTNINNNIFNNVNQDVGNSGNWTTSITNNGKLNNVKAGNDYRLNLGNINLKNN